MKMALKTPFWQDQCEEKNLFRFLLRVQNRSLQEQFPVWSKWWMRFASWTTMKHCRTWAISLIAVSIKTWICDVCENKSSKNNLRQSPHIRRFVTTWIIDGVGRWISWNAMASFSECLHRAASLVSPGFSSRDTHDESHWYPCWIISLRNWSISW